MESELQEQDQSCSTVASQAADGSTPAQQPSKWANVVKQGGGRRVEGSAENPGPIADNSISTNVSQMEEARKANKGDSDSRPLREAEDSNTGKTDPMRSPEDAVSRPSGVSSDTADSNDKAADAGNSTTAVTTVRSRVCVLQICFYSCIGALTKLDRVPPPCRDRRTQRRHLSHSSPPGKRCVITS